MVSRQGKDWIIDQNRNVRDAINDNLQQAYEKRSKLLFRNYVIQEPEGKGAYGDVYRIHNKTKQTQQYAMKVIDLEKWKIVTGNKVQRIVELTKHEVNSLQKMNSYFIIKLHQCFYNDYCIVLILEYCNGGTLLKYLKSKNNCVDEAEAISIIKQICLGLFALYDRLIMHRDMKLENIMKHNGFFKIIDLGFSKEVKHQNEEAHHTQLGTPYTMAPEVIKGQPYGLKADIYSLGIILLKMVVNNFEFDERKPQILQKQLCLNKNNKPLSKLLLDFLIQTTKQDPSQRIGWDKLLKHPIFEHCQHITESKIIDLVERLFEQRKSCAYINIQSMINQNNSVLMHSDYRQKQAEERIYESHPLFVISNKHQLTKPQKTEQGKFMPIKKSIFTKNKLDWHQQQINQSIHCRPTIIDDTDQFNTMTQTKPRGDIFELSTDEKPSSHSLIAVRAQESKLQSSIFRERSVSQRVIHQNKPVFHTGIYQLSNSEDLDSPIIIKKWSSQLEQEKNKINVLFKKSQFIINGLIKPLEDEHKYKILDIASEVHVRLIFLLCQRALLDIETVKQFYDKHGKSQKIDRKLFKHRARYLKYSQMLDNPLSSKLTRFKKWLIYQPPSKIQIILNNGKEGKDFTRQEQIDCTVKYIKDIANDIHIHGYKKRLLAFQKIMELECSEKEFPIQTQSIIQKC